ncbi:MAG: DNA-binding protein [Clostridiales bacterium]|nr:DNA-binding protein [Clostridiales bacterium]MCD8082066.1 DNA-binding protein [Clostridiales bacterium]
MAKKNDNQSLFVGADTIASDLNVSKPVAYRLIREMNEELKAKNMIVLQGKVPRKYYQEKIYGLLDDK